MAGIENSLISNPGVSRWVTTAPGPGLTRFQVKSAKKMQLLEEAAKLAPDQQVLIDQLTKNKLAPGDMANFQGLLNSSLTDYMNKYNENPYYTFSREGKSGVRHMQSIVNNPVLTELARNYDVSQKTYDIAQKDGNLNHFNVVNGSLSAYNTTKKRIERINPDDLDGKTYIPLTFEQEQNQRVKEGFYNIHENRVEDPLTYNQVSYKDVVGAINDIVGTPGSTEFNQFSKDLGDLNSMLEVKYKSNRSQLNKKMNALFSDAGLPEQHKDTLLAIAYKNQHDRGEKIDTQKAYKDVTQMIRDIVDGKEVTSTLYDVSPVAKAKAATGGGDMTSANQGAWEAMILGAGAKPAPVKIKNPRSSTGYSEIQGTEFNSGFFEEYKEGNIESGKLPLNINPVVQRLKVDQAPITTVDGKRINPAYAIPAEEPNIVVYKDPNDGLYYMEFDAVATDSHAGTTFHKDTTEGVAAASPSDEQHWEAIGKYAAKLYKDGEIDKPFQGYTDQSYFYDEDRYRVRVKTQYNNEGAGDLARMYLDKLPKYVPKGAHMTGAGAGPPPDTDRALDDY